VSIPLIKRGCLEQNGQLFQFPAEERKKRAISPVCPTDILKKKVERWRFPPLASQAHFWKRLFLEPFLSDRGIAKKSTASCRDFHPSEKRK
jgi:hypothetical protein